MKKHLCEAKVFMMTESGVEVISEQRFSVMLDENLSREEIEKKAFEEYFLQGYDQPYPQGIGYAVRVMEEVKEAYHVFDVVAVEEDTMRMFPKKRVMVFSNGIELFEEVQQRAVELYKKHFEIDENSLYNKIHYGCMETMEVKPELVEEIKEYNRDILTEEQEDKQYSLFDVVGVDENTGRMLEPVKVLVSVRYGESFERAKEKAISLVKGKAKIRFFAYFKNAVNLGYLDEFKKENPDVITE